MDNYKYIECKICNKECISLVPHIISHNLTCDEYKIQFDTNKLTSQYYKDNMRQSLKDVIKNDSDYLKRVSEGVKKAQSKLGYREKMSKAYKKFIKNNPEQHKKGIQKRKEGLHKYWNFLSENEKIKKSLTSSQTAKNTWKNKRKLMLNAIHRGNIKLETANKRSISQKKYQISLTNKQKQERSKKIKERINKPENRENFLKWGLAGSKAALKPKAKAKRKKIDQDPKIRKQRSLNRIKTMQNQPIISKLNIKFDQAMKKVGLIEIINC